jgi:glutaconate CoA-transferase subunit A
MPEIRTVRSPYPGPDGGEGEELIAMPAIELDVALIHMNRADQAGNGQFLGPDLFMDDWFAMAAQRTFMSCERIIATEDFGRYGSFHTQRISRLHVTGVVESPGGAHFTECPPDYGRDEAFQREYAATASSPEAWEAFRARWLDLESEREYQAAVAARRQESA